MFRKNKNLFLTEKFDPLILNRNQAKALILLHGFGVTPQLFAELAPFLPSWPFLMVPNKAPDCTKPLADNIFCYGFTPIKAVQELLKLKKELKAELRVRKILPEILCLHGKKDGVAGFQHSAELAEKTPGISFIPLKNSRHYLLHDVEKEIVYQKITDFLTN